jgi:subtilisin family serine protease
MYRVFCLVAWTAFFMLSISSGVFALHDGTQPNNAPSLEASALIVKFSPDVQLYEGIDKSGIALTNNPELNAFNKKYGVRQQHPVLSQLPLSSDNPLKDVILLYPQTGSDMGDMAREYAASGSVEYAYPNYQLELHEIPDDALFEHQWSFNNTGQGCYHVERIPGYYNDTLTIVYGSADSDIDALETYESPPDNTKSTVVAIIDTGVDKDHPELTSQMWNNPGEIPDNGLDDDHNGYVDDVIGWNFVDILYGQDNNNPADDHGHGTHCAGIVAAQANNDIGVAGITPHASIMAVKIFYDFTVTGACQGIIYAADNGADVINMSWGMCWPVPLLEDAIEYARSRGVVPVVSSGNHGDGRYSYPASFPAAISVGATNSDDHVTDFSTYNDAVDLCAPGQSILSLRAAGTDMYAVKSFEPLVHIIDEYYYLATGTSMAGPHVVAVAAYMRSVSPGLTPDFVQAILESSADDYVDPYGIGGNLPGWDPYSGHGRVNLPAALAATPNTQAMISVPSSYSTVSGSVDIIGLADGDGFPGYVLEYGEGGAPSAWTEITSSMTPVIDGLLGTWSTVGLQGQYTVRLRVGETNVATKRLFVADEPVAQIISPSEGQPVSGDVSIIGSALCPGFSHTLLEYEADASPGTWIEIGTCTTPVFSDEVVTWSTIALAPGDYNLRLSVYSDGGLEISTTVSVVIQTIFSPPNGWIVSLGGFPGPVANFADVNQDGINEIVIGTDLGMRFFSTGGAYLTSGVPNFPQGDYRVPVAVGKLDGDQHDDIVAVEKNGILYGFPSAGNPFQITLAEPPDYMGYFIPGDESRMPRLFLKDINNDGIDEIHYFPGMMNSTRTGYYFIYNADGSPWACNFPPTPTYKRCLPADLDGDGIDEIYCYGSDLAQFDTCGQWVRSVPVMWNGLNVNDFNLDLSAVDIDDDGKLELILHGFFNLNPAEVYNHQIFAYDEELSLKSGWPHDLGIDGRLLAPGHPVFGDLDNDGTLEYVAVHSDQEFGYVHAWHIDGTPVQGCDCADGIFAVSLNPAVFSAPLIVDCDNNGLADIAVASGAGILSVAMTERILAFGTDAQTVEGYPLVIGNEYILAGMHAPTYGDINQNGSLDVVYPTDHGYLAFTSFPEYAYDSDLNPCPMWRYNRRLNATKQFVSFTLCGDANGDADVNVGDAVSLINYVFKDGPAPVPRCLGDANGDGDVSVGDAVFLINYIFRDGDSPWEGCCP